MSASFMRSLSGCQGFEVMKAKHQEVRGVICLTTQNFLLARNFSEL